MDAHTDQALSPGVAVEVFIPYSSSWVRGFEVATSHENRYELLRRSDHSVLPTTFHADDLRLERR